MMDTSAVALGDLKLEIGEKISPLYNAGLQATATATEKVVGFMREHSTAAKVILTALAALAAVLVVCGTLTIVLAGVLGRWRSLNSACPPSAWRAACSRACSALAPQHGEHSARPRCSPAA